MATFRKRGKKTYAEVWVGDHRKAKSFDTKTEAKNWARDTEQQLIQLAAGSSLTHTLGDVFERYRNEIAPQKKGARWEDIRLEMFQRFKLSEIKLIDLKREDLEDYIDTRLRTVKSSSVNRELNLISHCLTQARRWRLMKTNPMADLKRPRDPPPRDRLISKDEIEQILVALSYAEDYPVELQRQRVAVAFLFAIETAMRAGEICNLKPEHVDLEHRTAHLPQTKNGHPRDVPLSTEAARLLVRLEPWGESIFRLRSSVLSQLFMQAVKRTEIEDLTFHDTRHEATTRLAKKLDLLPLARVTGHKDLKKLQIYYNETARELAKALD